MFGIGDAVGMYLLLVFVEITLAILCPSEKGSWERGKKVGWEKLGGFPGC